MPQHRRFRLNAANAPAQYTKAIDHGGVAVGAYQGIGACDQAVVGAFLADYLGEVLKVDLVADAGARRYNTKIVEGTLAPFQKLVALEIALHFHCHVLLKSTLRAEIIDADRVVYHQVYRR